MSHFSKIKTKIKNKKYLIEALKNSGYHFKVGDYDCVGYNGNKTPVDILIELNGTDYNLGFKSTPGGFELIADWYGITGINWSSMISKIEMEVKTIEHKVQQQYAYETTLEKMKQKGFSIEEETREDGEIRLSLKRMV